MEEFSHPEVKSLLEVEGNNECFDCGIWDIYLGKPNPQWVSINNAIFVCLECAGKHRNLGVQISYIKSLTIDQWYYLLKYISLFNLRQQNEIDLLKKTGNKSFKKFLNEYNIPKNSKFELKYKIKASDYYRKMIMKLNKNENIIEEKPDYEDGLLFIDSYSKIDLSIFILNFKI